MRAKDVARAFEKIAPPSIGLQGDRDHRILEFRFGDSNLEVTGIGVAWYLSIEVIQQAVEKDLNFLLIHEPGLFFRTTDSVWYTTVPEEMNPANLRRKKLLLEKDICVYTAHSNWDLQPEVGMLPTIAGAFGLTDLIARDKGVGIYAVPGITFGKLIQQVKKGTGLGQLRVWGDRARKLKKVVLGFGGIGSADPIIAHEADAGIMGQMNEFQFMNARENDKPVIEATHLVSESIGFRAVVPALRKKLPNARIEFLEVSFSYEWA